MKTLTKRKAGGVPKEDESAEKKAKTATKRKAGGVPKEAESAEKKAKREMCMAEAVKDVRALFEQPGIELSDETLKKKLLRKQSMQELERCANSKLVWTRSATTHLLWKQTCRSSPRRAAQSTWLNANLNGAKLRLQS